VPPSSPPFPSSPSAPRRQCPPPPALQQLTLHSQANLSPEQSTIVHKFHSRINEFATHSAWKKFNTAAQTAAKEFYHTRTADRSAPTEAIEVLYDGLAHDVEFVATQTILTGAAKQTLYVVADEFLSELKEAGTVESDEVYKTAVYETAEGTHATVESSEPYETAVETAEAYETAGAYATAEAYATTEESAEATATAEESAEATWAAEESTLATSIVRASYAAVSASAAESVAPIVTAEPGAAAVKVVSRVLVGIVVGGVMVVVAVL